MQTTTLGQAHAHVLQASMRIAASAHPEARAERYHVERCHARARPALDGLRLLHDAAPQRLREAAGRLAEVALHRATPSVAARLHVASAQHTSAQVLSTLLTRAPLHSNTHVASTVSSARIRHAHRESGAPA
jgi:hypothetical protein